MGLEDEEELAELTRRARDSYSPTTSANPPWIHHSRRHYKTSRAVGTTVCSGVTARIRASGRVRSELHSPTAVSLPILGGEAKRRSPRHRVRGTSPGATGRHTLRMQHTLSTSLSLGLFGEYKNAEYESCRDFKKGQSKEADEKRQQNGRRSEYHCPIPNVSDAELGWRTCEKFIY